MRLRGRDWRAPKQAAAAAYEPTEAREGCWVPGGGWFRTQIRNLGHKLGVAWASGWRGFPGCLDGAFVAGRLVGRQHLNERTGHID